jgi:hypothetical protein
MPIHLRDLPNFDGNSGKPKTILLLVNIFVPQKLLIPDDGQKIAYAVTLLSDRAAKRAMGFAAET